MLTTLLGCQHMPLFDLETFFHTMIYIEQDLEFYFPHDARLCAQVPALLVRWVHISISNCMVLQWQSTSEFLFPDLALL